jgi:cytochrome P450
VQIEERDGRLVCPFDHHTPEFAASYRDIYSELGEAGTLVWSDKHNGYWIVVRPHAMRAVLMDADSFTVEPTPDGKKGGVHIPRLERAVMRPVFLPGETDGKAHDDVRIALNEFFSKRVVARISGMIDGHVRAGFDKVAALESFDVIDDFASPVIAAIVSEHLGFELDNPLRFFQGVFKMASGRIEADWNEDVKDTFLFARQYLADIVVERRANPREDLVSHLTRWQQPAYDDATVQAILMNIIVGSAHTTSTLIGHLFVLLQKRPDIRERLAATPKDIDAAIEEALRYFDVAMAIGRLATRDVEIDGVIIKAGDPVLVPVPIANHDPAAYPDPNEFDIDRGAARHLGMGVGTHFCLGAWLARGIIASVLRQLLTEVGEFRVDLDKVVSSTDKAGVNGFDRVPASVTRTPTG